ncbi:hypothetical protein [Azospirillum sp. sgz302134]
MAAIAEERAELIRFQHHRLGTSVKMIAAIMNMTQAEVKAVLAEPPRAPEPKPAKSPPPPAPRARRKRERNSLAPPHLNGPAAGPSDPTEPEAPARARGGQSGTPRVKEVKVPDAAPRFATPTGYVPLMSDTYRRRPA